MTIKEFIKMRNYVKRAEGWKQEARDDLNKNVERWKEISKEYDYTGETSDHWRVGFHDGVYSATRTIFYEFGWSKLTLWKKIILTLHDNYGFFKFLED